MQHPNIIFRDPRYFSIHIKNILRWANNNPEIEKNFSGIDFEVLTNKMGEIIDGFFPVWNTNEEFIMKSIPDATGFDWDTESSPIIEIYSTPFFNSFSHPLFLRICSVRNGTIHPRASGHILGTLIHELLHHNIGELDEKIDHQTEHAYIDVLTKKVLNSISAGYFVEYEDFQKKIGQEIDTSIIPAELLSGEVTLREFCKKEQGGH